MSFLHVGGTEKPKPKRKVSTPKPVKQATEKELRELIAGSLMILQVTAGLAGMITDERDMLNPEELSMLSDASAETIIAHPKVHAVFSRLAAGAGASGLGVVIIRIAVPRLANHGVIPEEVSGKIVDAIDNLISAAKNPETFSMESIRASDDTGGYGNGKDNVHRETATDQEMASSAEKQSRLSELRGLSGSQNGQSHRPGFRQPIRP